MVTPTPASAGSQRLPFSRLKNWGALGYEMFIRFGMTTFSGDAASTHTHPTK